MIWKLILTILFAILSLGITLYALWIGVVSVIGSIVPEKTYPAAEPLHIAVMICARNEETVIGQLVDSLRRQDYPEDCYRIFVVAHNCRDRTAELAAAHGAEVLVRNAPVENRKAQALQYGLDCVRKKYGGVFSHYAVFDADGLVHPDFLREISAALSTGADAASGYYSSKNFEDSLVSRLSGTLYSAIMHSTCIPHGKLGLPVNVYGSGYAAKMDCGVEPDMITTIVDDFEFSTQLVMQGKRLIAAPKAIFYAEMPVKLRDALIQRRRWAVGDTQCFRKYARSLFRAIPALGWSGVKQFMDLIMNPTAVCTVLGLILYAVTLLRAGRAIVLLRIFIPAVLIYCAVFWYCAAYSLKKEGRSLRGNIAVCLLFPLWILITPVFAVGSIFRRDVKWEETRRTSCKSIEDML